MKNLAIINANIISLTPGIGDVRAVLVKDGRIASVGSNSDILSQGRGLEALDLKGKTLLPGFIDTHMHFASSGLAKIDAFLGECESIEEVFSLISKSASEGRAYVRASGFDLSRLKAKRTPTREELDALVPDRPAYIIRRDGHSAILNSKALEYVGLSENTPGMGREPEGGKPTGILRGIAWERAGGELSYLIDHVEWKQTMWQVAEDAMEVGITTVHSLDSAWVADAVITHADLLPIKTIVYYQTTEIETALALGLPRIGGCLLIDGTLASHTAALSEPYADDPSSNGILYFNDEELFDFIEQAHVSGLQISMHAIGDRAIKQLLNAYERVLTEYPRLDHRHRIEHFMLPDPVDVKRAARLGVLVSMQPSFCHLWGGEGSLYWQRLGRERYERLSPLRPAMEEGIPVGGGSDSVVSPLNPMLGVHAAVNDQPNGHRLNVMQALKMFTLDAAYLAFEENEKGSITPGKVADFVVLEESPLEVPPRELKDIPVALTIIDGEVKYSNLSHSVKR